MASLRLERLDALVRELSVQEDAEHLLRVFDRQAEMVLRRDGVVALTRRELEPRTASMRKFLTNSER